MFDSDKIALADGQSADNYFVLDCLENSGSSEGFVVSKYSENQTVTVRSKQVDGELSVDINSPVECADTTILSIHPNNYPKERAVSVKCSQSAFYLFDKQAASLVCITVDNLRSFIAAVKRHIKRITDEMKGKLVRQKVYTLCLLRL